MIIHFVASCKQVFVFSVHGTILEVATDSIFNFFNLAIKKKLKDNRLIRRGVMFIAVGIFAGVRAGNRAQKPITLFFKTTCARYPVKRYIPFYITISVIAIKE
jgi:hypothetical protein